MKKDNKNTNKTYFNGPMNFNGPTQIATGDIINNHSFDAPPQKATYTPEPIWRSPFTMAVLTWLSVIIGIASLFPFGKIVKCIVNFLSGDIHQLLDSEIPIYSIIFAGLFFLVILILTLRRTAKNQTRHPLLFNFAISGFGGHLTLEKIHIDKCPQCGGKMKYYNKPVEWREIVRADGSIKREVTKKVPALECKRNAKHWYEIDPAEDKVK